MEMNYDQDVRSSIVCDFESIYLIMPKELHDIERELQVEILPGTEVMTDVVSFGSLCGRRDETNAQCIEGITPFREGLEERSRAPAFI